MAYRTAMLRGQALGAHMRAALASREPESCRHCQKLGCACGQSEAAQAVELARELPLPSGTMYADREADGFRKSIPAGPLTRDALSGLALSAESLASYHALGARTVDAEACRAVAQAARSAAAKMP